jgi:hypothetical protein
MNTKRDRAFCDAPGDATDSIKFYCRFPYRNDETQIMCDWLPARYQENYICFYVATYRGSGLINNEYCFHKLVIVANERLNRVLQLFLDPFTQFSDQLRQFGEIGVKRFDCMIGHFEG